MLFVGLMAFQWLAQQSQTTQLAYSEFKRYLADGKIREVVISPAEIRGKLVMPGGEAGQAFRTNRVEDPGLVQELQDRGVKFSGAPDRSFLGGLLGWILPVAALLLVWRFMMRRMGDAGKGMLGNVGQSKARLVAEASASKTIFADVAGIDESREELEEVVEFLRNPRKFQQLGGRIPKGVLLVGAPGTGKTLLARAVAGEAGVPFFNISGSEFVEMFVGVGAARVRDLFKQAATRSPCIVFIDELDALGKARGFNHFGGHDEREQTLNQLLVEMDGFDARSGVIIIAATNRPEILDPALLRPGRFDRQVAVDRPDVVGREAILAIHARKIKLAPKVNLRTLAAQTPGFVGADLANIVNEAALLAARRDKKQVGMAELEEAIERVVAGLEKKNRLIGAEEKRVVAYHEAGHAVTSALLPHADPVHRISIVPRGVASLGHTMQLPTEERYLMSKSQLEDQLAVLLGGRAAEELACGEITTGAQSDLAQATAIARAMVEEYGMSERMGLASYQHQGSPFLTGGGGMAGEKEYSDRVAGEIDEEVKGILDRARARAQGILVDHRELLEGVASRLLEREVLSGEELGRLVGQERRAAAVAGSRQGPPKA